MTDVLTYAVPGFILLLIVEYLFGRLRGRNTFEGPDTAASLAMGIGTVFIGIASHALELALFSALYPLAFFEIPMDTWWGWVIAMLLVDLAFYWAHRFHHEVRFFWAAHVNHHSSERYNLATALRQSWTELFTIIPFFAVLPLLGVHPLAIFVSFSINLIYQFWVHTEHIGSMGAFGWVFNTPSHHRVHHGSNLRYLDKNYAGILIIWDRMFGTFEAEDAAEPVKYGLTKNIRTYNPFKIAFHEWIDLGRSVRRAPNMKAALLYLVRPPGWSHDGSTRTTDQLRAAASEEPPATSADEPCYPASDDETAPGLQPDESPATA